MSSRQHSTIMTKVVKEAGMCELCGSKRALEAHHIIPIVAGGIDSYDNLLCVCNRCHALLTPRSLLTKLGKEKVRQKNQIVDFKVRLYEAIENNAENGIGGILDAIESTW